MFFLQRLLASATASIQHSLNFLAFQARYRRQHQRTLLSMVMDSKGALEVTYKQNFCLGFISPNLIPRHASSLWVWCSPHAL